MSTRSLGRGLSAVLVLGFAAVGCSSSEGAAAPGSAGDLPDAAHEEAGDAAPEAKSDASDAAPLSVSAVVRKNPNMVVSAFVDVTAPGADEVVVHHGDDTTYPYETPPVAVDAAGHATIVLLGLLPAATTHLEVVASSAAGRTGSTGDVTFDTSALPAGLGMPASYDVITDDGTADGYVLSTWNSPVADNAIMLDRHGRVMWYRPIDNNIGPGVFDRLSNGHFVVSQPDTADFEEVDLAGDLVRRWSVDASTSPIGLDGHEFLPLPDGHVAVIGGETHGFDSSPYFAGGGPNAVRIDNSLIDLDPNGVARVLWSSYGYFQPDELTIDPTAVLDPFDPLSVDMAHANAITLAPDGNLLISCRALSQILKIDRVTGAVLWRLGGKLGQFTFQGDSDGGFSMQHDPRYTAAGRLRVFDNGNLHAPQETRVVEYDLDETAKIAKATWEYRHVPAMYTQVAGSARELPGGRVLVNFPWTGTAVEIDEQLAVHWELQVAGSGAYRMTYAPTLYP